MFGVRWRFSRADRSFHQGKLDPEFCSNPRDILAAIDSTTVEVWSKSGLVTFELLFVMELESREYNSFEDLTAANDYVSSVVATSCQP